MFHPTQFPSGIPFKLDPATRSALSSLRDGFDHLAAAAAALAAALVFAAAERVYHLVKKGKVAVGEGERLRVNGEEKEARNMKI